ncbi:translocase of chloroplast 159, chloroplastic-like [Andrographis paniculata]|uniref:translocase of chloroplast 159, chloroplastic-like n=1 Tax=Andrographis paniculata TaxID=175694 RepID=UPI0021E75EB4|nr:translocase of chloroplast 159, chloroplastic-like [Andrographis paniculata]
MEYNEEENEAASNHVPEASAGSSVPSSFQYADNYRNYDLLDESAVTGFGGDGDSISRNGVRGAASEDEDYLSGAEEDGDEEEEEFLMALDKPVLDETVGEIGRDKKFDSHGEGEPGDGGGFGEGNKDGEGYENDVREIEEDKVGGKHEVLDSDNGVAETMDGDNSDKEKQSELLPVSKPEEEEKVISEVADGKEGESKLLNIRDELNEPLEKVVSEVADEKLEACEEREQFLVRDELSEPQEKVVSEVVVDEPEEFKSGEATLMPSGDSVVDTIQVDVVYPGVAVVGETEENGHMDDKPAEKDICEVAVAKSAYDVLEEEEIGEGKLYKRSSEPVGETKDEKDQKNENSEAGVGDGLENGVHTSVVDDDLKKPGGLEIGGVLKSNGDGDDHTVLNPSNGENANLDAQNDGSAEEVSEESKPSPIEIREVDEDSISDGGTDDILGGSQPAKNLIDSGEGSHTGPGSSVEQSPGINGQIVTDSEEDGDSDDGGDGKEMFDSAALEALLRAATGSETDSNSINITSRDGSRLFTLDRPAGLGSSHQSMRPAPRQYNPNTFSVATHATEQSEESLSDAEKKKLEKLQQIRVKFLRLVHRLGLSIDENMAAQVLYRLALLGGRSGSRFYSLDAAKNMALQLEEGGNDLDFSVNILVIGKSGAGKSATINSLFGEKKASVGLFETGTASAQQLSGIINGVKVNVIDTPGLKASALEQSSNSRALSPVKKLTKKNPLDAVIYIDRLDAQSRGHSDLPLLKTVSETLGSSIWRNAVIGLTHAASAPPDGPSGTPLSYDVYVSQMSRVVQQYIGHAAGDLRMMTNPVSLVENHSSCRKNREGQKILPNGQSWRPQLLLLCYSMKILSEASNVAKQQEDTFDPRRLFGFRARSPPLPYMLSTMLMSRPHPKLPDGLGIDVDLDDLSDSDFEGEEEEDEYDQLPPFKPLKKAQIAKLSKEQKQAYLDEYDYRVKLFEKKQWKEEIRKVRDSKNKPEEEESESDAGAPAPMAVMPEMALPLSFDADSTTYRYRGLEPSSTFIARAVYDSHGWDHDCGYDGVNLEHNLAIANRFPAAYTVQFSKDKKRFSVNLDSSISAKHGEKISTMAGFDVQAIGKQLAYILRAETKLRKILKRNKHAGGVFVTFLGENVIPGVRVEDQISLGKEYMAVISGGAVRSQQDTAYGGNVEVQRREFEETPAGQVQSSLSLSVVKWRGDLALGFNGVMQLSLGRNTKVAVRAGVNNKMSGHVTVRTSSSDHLSLAVAAIVPTLRYIYSKFWVGEDRYSIY